MQAVRTNVLGTENVLEAAISAGVKRVVCLSTDKAVYPINAMGISKAMMEKVMVAASRNLEGTPTVICGTRYGNVMASRGSVIPLFVEQVQAGKPITVTDPSMTRFMMTLDDAVDLVLYAFEHGKNGDMFVQKAPAATVAVLTQAILELMGKPGHEVREIGTRHGEKLYEALLSREELACAEDLGDYYRVPPDGRLQLAQHHPTGRGWHGALAAEAGFHAAHRQGRIGSSRRLSPTRELRHGNTEDPVGGAGRGFLPRRIRHRSGAALS
jgi:UDP-glucose 4-epimerase